MMKHTTASSYHTVQWNGLRAHQYPLLAGTTHAIFGRQGGVSPSPWRSLNMGHAVGDAPDNVRRNFERACAALKIDPRHTVSCHLVHGNRVLTAEANGRGPQLLGRADALITRQPGLVLTMRFADCVPLLFFDPVSRSVGLAHAGWRGVMQNVMGAVVEAMQTRFGARPADIRVVIGPSIGPCCYQVGEDVRQAARAAFGEADSLFDHRPGGMYFDLWAANVRQARAAGVRQVTVAGVCTACHTGEFFSHRAEKGRTGRFGAFIGLPGTVHPTEGEQER